MPIVIDGDGTVSGISVGGLPDGVVDAGTLASNAVTSVKIADDAVVEAKIGASAVVTAAINDDAVTNAKVAANAVAEAQLAANAVVTGKIEDGTIANIDIGSLAASKLTGALPAISGASLTGLTSTQMPAGSAIQVVTASDNTTITLSGTLGVYSTGVSATITPSSTASKIIVIAVLQYHLSSGNHAAIASRILRASTNIHATSFNGYYGAETFNRIQSQTVTVLDSPNTASAVTYYLQGANEAGSTNIGPYVGKLNQYNESSIMLIEIKG
jgi:hypothetical protein